MEKSSSDATNEKLQPEKTPIPERKRIPLKWKIAVSAFLLISGAAGGWLIYWTHKGTVAPRGGLYFFQRSEIAVPQFFQSDERWKDDQLADTDGTLGGEGCAVSSAAMVLASYGFDTDPQRLNTWLKENEGFTGEGWIYWEKAAEMTSGMARLMYEDKPSYALIDWNLMRRNPVIVRVQLKSGVTHFVVVSGKKGFDYLICDPSARGRDGVYPLKEIGSPIQALRYYRKQP